MEALPSRHLPPRGPGGRGRAHPFRVRDHARLPRPPAIPAFDYEVAFAGGNDIRCAPCHHLPGTQELSDAALEALRDRRACLLAHHGVIAFGSDLDDALRLADKVEALARLYWQALQVGEPAILDDSEMALIVERFRHYGPRNG